MPASAISLSPGHRQAGLGVGAHDLVPDERVLRFAALARVVEVAVAPVAEALGARAARMASSKASRVTGVCRTKPTSSNATNPKIPFLRPLVDEIVEPADLSSIVLQHLDSDCLTKSNKKRLSRPEINSTTYSSTTDGATSASPRSSSAIVEGQYPKNLDA
ncbi:hypothetical protein GGTG_08014 [Gaeumannomyces tritici R3-111a-1]|uniref:Uncharacterized protein n=1 Tax=Gaeumannomyces tritici (strain R3-111a-1) TaxID=644352 RepID=J3P3C7_GAET3|nr:hypothetical protein GGTG_08014 [Gaeumannomyces tritici R3-111a-1]EJT74169.1 hypothetical protein GGTG_08014 [Gaeumannomyces tritici R3-111a-1]